MSRRTVAMRSSTFCASASPTLAADGAATCAEQVSARAARMANRRCMGRAIKCAARGLARVPKGGLLLFQRGEVFDEVDEVLLRKHGAEAGRHEGRCEFFAFGHVALGEL